jgi:renin receptor
LKGRVQGAKQPAVKAQPKAVETVEAAAPSGKNITNLAEFYSDQYPAMFNIIFWTSLILGVAVFSIAYSMWSMDPGLDTVIYRMTSQRIKKDN